MRIFAYGTLAEPERVQRMLGHPVEMRDAILHNHIRLRPAFFMAFPHQGAEVRGKLLLGLSLADITRFDRYEGNGRYYCRTPVQVECAGSLLDAESYLGGPAMAWYYQEQIRLIKETTRSHA